MSGLRRILWVIGLTIAGLGCSTGLSVVADNVPDGSMDAVVVCTAPQTLCGSHCADTQNDTSNCGSCGMACTNGMTCVAGACQVSCPASQTPCGSQCVTFSTDGSNCGACGHVCPSGQVCSLGRCSTSCDMSLATCASSGDGGTTVDGGSSTYCANVGTDRLNCGACGNVCPAGNICVGCVCEISCPTGQTACGNACLNLQTDSGNCGVCGNACPSGNACVTGMCAVSCSAGLTVCGSGCANLQTDNVNCGACGTTCAAGQVCSDGACGTTCAAPQTTCGSGMTAYCANTAIDPANCGTCGATCALTNVMTDGCTAGACTVVLCAAGFGDCDGMAANGCETSTLTSAGNCGVCGRACVLPHAATNCSAGACTVTSCGVGFADCNMAAADGCEVDTQTDNANCGACAAFCPPGQVCSGGTCGTTCAPPLMSCGTAPTTFCANASIDRANCGACGNLCNLANTAIDGCTGGMCTIVGCSAGFGDCDTMAADGCETNLLSSMANCGACGRSCVLSNATAACAAGVCSVTACQTGFADCDSAASDGCEVNTQTDNTNCGACGTTCPAGQVCSGGVCGTTCAAPLVTCGTGASASCTNTAIDPTNCSACGAVCALANVATDGCAASACTVVRCTAGFGDCDAVASNGCETNTTTSAANCGACGRACTLANATTACSASVCGITACATGFADCDHSAVDGCEINTLTDNANCGGCSTVCPAGTVCTGGGCRATCASPLTTCGTGASASCTNTAIDPANCGSCGHACALTNTASDGCAASACTVIRCDTGFGDCDGVASNGCEVNTTTSAANCGACGRACVLANATSNCAASACAITACTTGFADCNHTAADGCEVNTQTDNANCGACGAGCSAGQVCSGGACRTTCASPLVTCGSGATAYCANTSVDPANCGTCGTVCSLPETSIDGCSAGVCAVVHCVAGFADCDGVASNGCEVNTSTSDTNCGACGTVCSSTEACSGGACSPLASCAALLAQTPTLASGTYTIDPDGVGGAAPFPVYCDMTSSGGGWTLVMMAADSPTGVFGYDAAAWTDTTTMNPTVTDITLDLNVKSPAFNTLPFTAMRFCLATPTACLNEPVTSTAARVLFAGPYRAGTEPISAFTTWGYGDTLGCNAIGFNVYDFGGGPARYRYGILLNNEATCEGSVDGGRGFGGHGYYGTEISAGQGDGIVTTLQQRGWIYAR